MGRVDEHDLIKTRFGIERKHHAGCTRVAADHALHADGERDVGVNIALMDAIGDRPVVVEGSKYLFYRMKKIIYAIDIKECFLLTCKGGVGEILSGCRRANRDTDTGRFGAEPLVGGADGGLELRRERSGRDRASDGRATPPERGNVVDVERREPLLDAMPEAVFVEELAECEGSRRKAAGHADPGSCELADHLAERSVFSSDAIDVGHPQLIEPDHSFLLSHGIPRVLWRHGESPPVLLRFRFVAANSSRSAAGSAKIRAPRRAVR